MKVILLDNIRGVGRIGDVRDVADGYGRNFLIPRRLAKLATENSEREIETLKAKAAVQVQASAKEAAQHLERLKDLRLTFDRKASSSGTLFAGLTEGEIAEALSKALGAAVPASAIDLGDHEGHIKHVGEHRVTVKLTPELSGDLEITINGLE